jgi:hypothetical protein
MQNTQKIYFGIVIFHKIYKQYLIWQNIFYSNKNYSYKMILREDFYDCTEGRL